MSSQVLKLGAAGLSLVALGMLISAIPSFAQDSPSSSTQAMDDMMNAVHGGGTAQAMHGDGTTQAMPGAMGLDADAMIAQCTALMRQMSGMMQGNGMMGGSRMSSMMMAR